MPAVDGRFLVRDPGLLRALVDKLPAMLAYWDSEQRCHFANRAYERWFGVAPESLIGKRIDELLGPRLYALNRPYIEGALRGEAQEFERTIPDPAGGPPRHSLASYVPDVVDGVVRGFFVLVTDVSEIKRVELALRESEEKLAGIVSMSPDAIVSIDDDQRIVLFNDGAEKIFGFERAEVLGRPLDVLIPPRFREAHRRHVRDFALGDVRARRIDEGRPPIFGLRKNGEEFPAEAAISKVEVGDKRLLSVTLRDITERTRIEDERRVFIALLDNSSDFIGIADPNGKPVYVNAAGRRMIGLSPDFPVERTRIPEYYPPEERDFAANVIVREMTERGRWSGETYFRNWKTEEKIPVSDEHFLIRDPKTGRVLGMGTVTRDITEARRARERVEAANAELRQSEERFRLVIDEAPIGMALVALDGRFVRVNRALCEIVGYTAEELTGLTFQAITHPEDLDADVALAGRLLRGEIPRYKLSKRYVRKDGTSVDIMLNGSVLRGADGTPLYFIAQIEDISEQKRIERDQRFLGDVSLVLAGTLEYEETLTKIAELAVKDFADLCIVDVVEEANVRRVKVASRDPSKASLCKWIAEMPLDRERTYLLRSVLETKQPLLLERPSQGLIDSFAQSDEHLRALRAAEVRSVVATPLVVREKLLGAMAFFLTAPRSDVYGPSDLRLAEEIGRQAALSLENARLYRTAQQASRARDDVLGIVAHDLRNPLNVILMQASLMRRPGATPERRSQRPGEVVERAARRMNRLIQDLLDVTRLEAGQLSIERSRLSAERILLDSLEAQRPLAASASVDLRADVAPELPDVWADRDRILQVFENLIGNAVKFTGAGGRVTVGAAPRDGEVVFSVADTGRGIRDEDLPHVFDRFWQARREERRGAGLGLAIVKGIVESHGGRVWAESAIGRGSTFFFTIPVAVA